MCGCGKKAFERIQQVRGGQIKLTNTKKGKK